MQKIGINTAGIIRGNTVAGTYKLIAESGFDCVDAGICAAIPIKNIKAGKLYDIVSSEADLMEYVRPFGESAKAFGLENYQCHAPFPINTGSDDLDSQIEAFMPWFIHAADAINCRRLVIHPFRSYNVAPLSDAECEEKTIRFFETLIPAAKEYGVTVCMENMFAGHIVARINKLFASTCSNIDQACRMVDTLNNLAGAECFGFCLDTGHLLLASQDVRNFLPRLGHRLKALHIHDNNGQIDQHHAPFTGAQDWDYFTDAVAASVYDGVLSFEISGVWDDTPRGMWPATMKWIAESGRWLAKEIAEKRSKL